MVGLIDWKLRLEAIAFVPQLQIAPDTPALLPSSVRVTLSAVCYELFPRPSEPQVLGFLCYLDSFAKFFYRAPRCFLNTSYQQSPPALISKVLASTWFGNGSPLLDRP